MEKIRLELLSLGYTPSEVNNILQELAGRQKDKKLSPNERRLLCICLQEKLDFARALKHNKAKEKPL